MASAPVDIPVKVKGLSDLQKLERRMEALEKEVTRLQAKLPKVTKATEATGRAAATATGNIQRFGVAFRTTVAPIVAAYGALNFFSRSLRVAGEREADIALLTNGLTKLGQVDALEKLQKQANEFGNATLFNQEDFTAGAGLLTSFGSIAVKEYSRVIDIAGDLAQTNKVGVKDSLLQVAKALNAPKEGLTALSRSGIQFTEQQKNLIKGLVDAGRAAEAQELILRELEKQYGGNARAAAQGLEGAQDSLAEAFRDFQEVVGEGVLPVVTEFIEGATELFKRLSALDPQMVENAARAAVFAGKLVLVSQAVKGLIALKAGITAMLAATAVQATTAGNASAGAAVKVNALAASLRRLAAIGIVTVGVEFLWNGVRTGQQAEELQQGLESGAFNNTLKNLPYEQAQAALRREEKNLTKLLAERDKKIEELQSYGGGGAKTIFGVTTGQIGRLSGEIDLLNLKIAKSQKILSSDIRPMPKPEDLGIDPTLLDLGGTGSQGGGGATATLQDDTKQAQDMLETLRREVEILGITEGLERDLKQVEYERLDNLQRIAELQNVSPALTEQLTTAANLLALEKEQDLVMDSVLSKTFQQTKAFQDMLLPLQDQRELLEAKLNGTEKEYRLNKEIERLTKGMSPEFAAQVEEILRGNEALRDRLSQMQQMERIWSGIGTEVTGVFDALIEGTDDWNAVLTDTLKSLSKLLLNAGLGAIGQSAGKDSILGKLFGGFRADGGPVSSGKSYVVGERGPELFVPGSSGRIIPNDAGGGVTVINNINISDGKTTSSTSGTSEAEAAKLARMVEASTMAVITRERRPGGLLTR